MFPSNARNQCAEDDRTRRLVRDYGGLEPLLGLICDEVNTQDKALLSAATGAVWKCAKCLDNVHKLDQLDVINILVNLLKDEDEQVGVAMATHITNIIHVAEVSKIRTNFELLKLFPFRY